MATTWIFYGDGSRRGRGRATWTFRGNGVGARRRGYDADVFRGDGPPRPRIHPRGRRFASRADYEDGYDSYPNYHHEGTVDAFGEAGTTQIWGDGDPTNGIPPGYATDILVPGDVIELEATINVNNGQRTDGDPTLPWSGGDRIQSSHALAVTYYAFPIWTGAPKWFEQHDRPRGIFRGRGHPRPRRGRVAAPPRLRRGDSARTGRGDVGDVDLP